MPEPLNFQIDEYYLDLQQKGQVMEIIDEEETRRNPFPGLRPFRTSEAHLFFGREGQSEELIERLMRTRFLGVLGNSGSGKSSLVRAGLIPALHAGRKQAQVSDWKIVICRPGNSPIQNLAAALAGAALKDTRREVVEPEVRRLLPLLMESSFGLLEAEEGKGVRDKTLLIVDQFEELFRFGKEIPPGEAAHFVDLLLNAVGQEGAHIYVVITMRSEFLGECVRYRGLPEIINSGQYLVPRLSGENVRRAVTGPLAVVHAPVDAAFANRVVREVGDNMDQLPLMQHALMRSYKKWQDGGGQSSLGHVEYDAVGGMQQAMGHHADELYAALDDKGRAIARLLFQRLTDLSAGEQGGRRPTLMAEIYGLCEAVSANRTEVDAVIERFRDIGASFLMPPPGVALHDGNMLDISHESLVRNWTRLGEWAVEETEAARLYQRLEQGRMETNEEGGGLPPRVLENLCEWLEKSRVNAFWAARYHPGVEPAHDWGQHRERFEHNMRFFERSKAALEAEEKRIQEEKDQELQREKERAEKEAGLRREAEAQRVVAEQALSEIRLRNLVMFREFVELGTNLIYTLDHEEALEKLRVSCGIDVEMLEKRKLLCGPLQELLYFYGESCRRPELAVAVAGLLLGLGDDRMPLGELGRCVSGQWDNREQFKSLLFALPDYVELSARYYPLMVEVPTGDDGEFEMGSEELDWGHESDETLHRVRLLSYRMGVTAVTFYQFALYGEATGRGLKSRTPYWGRNGDHPVVNVNWYEAVEYSNWLNGQLGYGSMYDVVKERGSDSDNQVPTDFLKWKVSCLFGNRGYRLPTEAEWELASRGGVGCRWHLFSGGDAMGDLGWYWENSGDEELSGNWDMNRIYDNNGRTHTVGSKKGNGIGLYDMSGNVWEWCWDWYGSGYYGECKEAGTVSHPLGPKSSSDGRVLRGGSWSNGAGGCRSAYRNSYNPVNRLNGVGFRLVFVP